jgi:hypothetical protein
MHDGSPVLVASRSGVQKPYTSAPKRQGASKKAKAKPSR